MADKATTTNTADVLAIYIAMAEKVFRVFADGYIGPYEPLRLEMCMAHNRYIQRGFLGYIQRFLRFNHLIVDSKKRKTWEGMEKYGFVYPPRKERRTVYIKNPSLSMEAVLEAIRKHCTETLDDWKKAVSPFVSAETLTELQALSAKYNIPLLTSDKGNLPPKFLKFYLSQRQAEKLKKVFQKKAVLTAATEENLNPARHAVKEYYEWSLSTIMAKPYMLSITGDTNLAVTLSMPLSVTVENFNHIILKGEGISVSCQIAETGVRDSRFCLYTGKNSHEEGEGMAIIFSSQEKNEETAGIYRAITGKRASLSHTLKKAGYNPMDYHL